MTKKLIELTDARKEIIAATYREYLAVGLETKPADFDAAEKAITSLYASIGKKRPHFVRLNSPFAAELYINLLTKTWPKMKDGKQLGGQLGGQLRDQLWDQLGGQLRDQLRGQLWDQLGGQLRGQLWDQLRDQLGDQLRDQLWDQLRDQLGGQLWDQLRGQLWDQLWDQLGGQLWDQLRDQLGGQLRGQLGDQLRDQLRGQLRGQKLSFTGTWFYGQWDYLWPWLEGGRRVGAKYSAKQNDQLDAHLAITRSIGWWYPFDDFCIITDRPEKIALDDARRLHCQDGPALKYRDGYEVYSWQGTRIPSEWIRDKSLTGKIALTWPNLEQRRAACEIVGWVNVLKELKAKVIDTDEDPMIGELVEVTIPDAGKSRFLRVKCGTGREFALVVPVEMKTALEANCWTYNVEPDILRRLEVRT